jgi:hypothetical protein
MADFSPAKVIIDQAEYDYLKKLEAEEPAPQYKNALTDMYQLLLGLTVSRMSKYDRDMLERSLKVQHVEWSFMPTDVTGTLPKFVIESIPVDKPVLV